MQETGLLAARPGAKAKSTGVKPAAPGAEAEARPLPGPQPPHLPLRTDPSTCLLVPVGGIEGDRGMAPVLGPAALLADALPIGAAEGNQGAVVGRAHEQVPVLHGLCQLVAVQPAVLLVRPQVLRAVVHHAGQAGLHGPHPAGPEAEVAQDLRLRPRTPLPGRAMALSPALPRGAPRGGCVLFFCWAGPPTVWAEGGRRVSGNPGQRPWSRQIKLSHVEVLRQSWASSAPGPRILWPQSDASTTPS